MNCGRGNFSPNTTFGIVLNDVYGGDLKPYSTASVSVLKHIPYLQELFDLASCQTGFCLREAIFQISHSDGIPLLFEDIPLDTTMTTGA